MKTLRIVLLLVVFSSCSKEDDNDNCRCEPVVQEGYGTYYIEFCNDATYEDVIGRTHSNRWMEQFAFENPCK